MGGKWLSVLKVTAANMRRVAVLFGSDTPIDLAMMRSTEAVARSLGITIAASTSLMARSSARSPTSLKSPTAA